MSKVIQCVPNFSEGCRPDVVWRIAEAISSAGAKVIDSSLDCDHNRSVITFIGDPESVRLGVLAATREAVRSIDMRRHTGVHPRIGAVDVIPLVPVAEITMKECVELSHDIGEQIARELQIPVYFYERSAVKGHRKNLANVRRGGYEAFADVELTGDRAPDVGPHHFHPTAGATVIGARGPLIAFNVNLSTNDIELARRIAATIRTMRNEGRGFHGVKAMGVELASQGIVQVSTNITEPDKVTMFDVYDFVRREAAQVGVDAESELIGVVRLDALARSSAEALKLSGFDEKRVLDYWLE